LGHDRNLPGPTGPGNGVPAADPFAAYPVRADGLLLLARAVDLDSGRALQVLDRLVEISNG